MPRAFSLVFFRLALFTICVASLENSSEDECQSELDLTTSSELKYFRAFVRFVGDYSDDQFQERPTRILIHGCKECRWFISSEELGSISSSYDFKEVSQAYKANHAEAFNVVELEWSAGSFSYNKNSQYIRNDVARTLANYLQEKLGSNKERWKDLKIIGHSLGAHAAGFAGKFVRGGRIGSIIGLDPAST